MYYYRCLLLLMGVSQGPLEVLVTRKTQLDLDKGSTPSTLNHLDPAWVQRLPQAALQQACPRPCPQPGPIVARPPWAPRPLGIGIHARLSPGRVPGSQQMGDNIVLGGQDGLRSRGSRRLCRVPR